MGRRYWECFLPMEFTLYFFLCSRKFKITNHRPQAVSLKEPKTPIPFLKQVCEDLETVGPIVCFLFLFFQKVLTSQESAGFGSE